MQQYVLYCIHFSTSSESESNKNNNRPVQNPVQLPVKHSLQSSAQRPVQRRFPAEQKRMETRSQYRQRKVQESQLSQKTSG